MLEYRLDDLGWEGFEKLCQALLKAQLGVGVESWGGTGDWGNDAYCQAKLKYPGEELQSGPFQFQVKFVQGANAAGAKPNAALLSAVRRECERITARELAAPAVYSLLTNVVLSPQLRTAIELAVRDALPDCEHVVLHGGTDICSWLHLQPAVVRMFPQLLSHRDLVELLRRATTNEAEVPGDRLSEPESSAQLKAMKDRAALASRRHDAAAALVAWREVRDQAVVEGNGGEAVLAKLQTAVVAAASEHDFENALSIAEECLRELRGHSRRHRARTLQLIGEIHRNVGEVEKAKAALALALEHARAADSKVDVAFALLSLAALEIHGREPNDVEQALEAIEGAYTAMSALYADGDEDDRVNARDGLAQCHSFRAELFGHARPNEALAEWSRALDLFRSLGEGWEWYIGDTLARRADLLARLGDSASAARDLEDAVKEFRSIQSLHGLATCFLQAGELLDRVGRREEAMKQYLLAVQAASATGDDRRASYFYFRYSLKLLESRNFDDADAILAALVDSDAVTPEQKLDVLDQMCMVAEVRRDDEQLRERASKTLALTDDILRDSMSSKRRHHLLLRKARQLDRLGRTTEAVQAYRDAIDRLDPSHDRSAIAECWFQIRGVFQKIGDRDSERDASEKVLEIGGDDLSSVVKALTLVGLAQLNIADQRFAEAGAQLDRAVELDPTNPVVAIFESDLRRKLGSFVPKRRDATPDLVPQRDFAELVHELHGWCETYPKKQPSILSVWYYIHRVELWNIFRSSLGVKFLIATRTSAEFEAVMEQLQAHGDLFVWGTNFQIKRSRARGICGLDKIPVPKGFLFPAGTTIVTAAASSNERDRGSKRRSLLKLLGKLPVEPYYLTIMKGDEIGGTSPFFVGMKQKWTSRKVISFMIERRSRALLDGKSICLPLSEDNADPRTLRVMQVASENGAIPVFAGELPDTSGVMAVCDTRLPIPCEDHVVSEAVAAAWSKLVSTSEEPVSVLTQFKNAMRVLANGEGVTSVPARVYMLSFRSNVETVIYPAVVVNP